MVAANLATLFRDYPNSRPFAGPARVFSNGFPGSRPRDTVRPAVLGITAHIDLVLAPPSKRKQNKPWQTEPNWVSILRGYLGGCFRREKFLGRTAGTLGADGGSIHRSCQQGCLRTVTPSAPLLVDNLLGVVRHGRKTLDLALWRTCSCVSPYPNWKII